MGKKRTAIPATSAAADGLARILEQYGCGPIRFTGTDDALYERHLIFDTVADLKAAGPRERFEACARSVRDVLTQRWVRTEDTYERENPKRVYYLSIGSRWISSCRRFPPSSRARGAAGSTPGANRRRTLASGAAVGR